MENLSNLRTDPIPTFNKQRKIYDAKKMFRHTFSNGPKRIYMEKKNILISYFRTTCSNCCAFEFSSIGAQHFLLFGYRIMLSACHILFKFIFPSR